ncbi:MAG: hypothetical protein V4672_16320 [Verrucomicrobiota bacterium]
MKIPVLALGSALLMWLFYQYTQPRNSVTIDPVEKTQSATAMHYIISAILYYKEDNGGDLPKDINDLFPSVIEMPNMVVPEFMRRNLDLAAKDSHITPDLIDALGIWRIIQLDRDGKRFAIVGSHRSLTPLSSGIQLIPISIWGKNDFDDRFLTEKEVVELLDSEREEQ